jgi:hypothetical protein
MKDIEHVLNPQSGSRGLGSQLFHNDERAPMLGTRRYVGIALVVMSGLKKGLWEVEQLVPVQRVYVLADQWQEVSRSNVVSILPISSPRNRSGSSLKPGLEERHRHSQAASPQIDRRGKIYDEETVQEGVQSNVRQAGQRRGIFVRVLRSLFSVFVQEVGNDIELRNRQARDSSTERDTRRRNPRNQDTNQEYPRYALILPSRKLDI